MRAAAALILMGAAVPARGDEAFVAGSVADLARRAPLIAQGTLAVAGGRAALTVDRYLKGRGPARVALAGSFRLPAPGPVVAFLSPQPEGLVPLPFAEGGGGAVFAYDGRLAAPGAPTLDAVARWAAPPPPERPRTPLPDASLIR